MSTAVRPRQPDTAASEALLSCRNVTKHFPAGGSGMFRRSAEVVHAVDDVTLDVMPGETLGLVGETGCGKSTLARCMSRLFDITSGQVLFDGRDITSLQGSHLRPVRRDVQMVFQDPYGSLNPRRRVGSIIGDPYVINKVGTPAERKRRVQELMERVGLNPEHYNRFPAEFSGGQRQRIGVARALALQPRLLICDEPVSALDVSIQAQILNLLADLQDEFGLTYVFISHDLSVVRHVSDRIAVMYLGKVAELAPTDELFEHPRHPYTRALLSAVPLPDPAQRGQRDRIILTGDIPSPTDPPSGCRFHTRCPKARPECGAEAIPLEATPGDGTDHLAACLFPLADGEDLAAQQPRIADSAITEASAETGVHEAMTDGAAGVADTHGVARGASAASDNPDEEV